MRTARETWEKAKSSLQLQINRPNYDTWVRETVGLSQQGHQFVIGTPNAFAREALEKRFRGLITRVLMDTLGCEVEVHFQVCPAKETSGEAAAIRLLPMINPKHTFDSFVVGASNRFAFAAAMAAAEGPRHEHNPLYIFGPSGVGKSHIGHAVANYASEGGTRVVFSSSEKFTNEFINSIREKRTEQFRARFRSTDLLVLDDVQFVTGKPHVQEAVFHTFNEIQDGNGQLVVIGDRTPSSLTSIDSSLSSRLGCGLVVEIETPDLETRLAILRARADQLRFEVATSILEYIAQRCRHSVRDLEGSLNTVVALARMSRQEPTLQLAQQALRSFSNSAARQAVTPDSILDAVARHYQVSLDALKSRTRDHKVTQARHVAIYLVREKTNCGLEDLGRLLGRDHSTVLRGHQKIAGMLPSNPDLRKNVDDIWATFAR